VVALLHAGDLEAVALDAAQDLVACLLHRPVGRGGALVVDVGVGAVGSYPILIAGAELVGPAASWSPPPLQPATTRTRPATTTAATVCRSTSLLLLAA
jgi:hypothetical protein